MALTLEDLNQQVAEAQAALDARRATAEAAAAKAEERRAAAHRKFDEALLAEYDDAALTQVVRDAEQRLSDALLADPVWSAVVAVNQARVGRYLKSNAAKSAAANLKRQVDGLTNTAVPVGMAIELAELHRIAEREGARLADEEIGATEQARVGAGEAAARGK